MSKNSHAEISVADRAQALPGAKFPDELARSLIVNLRPIPFGIIPATGQVVVQRKQWRAGGAGPIYEEEGPGELSGRAKARIRATWDVVIPTVTELIQWIRAHYGKRGDAHEWAREIPALVAPKAQAQFFPVWSGFFGAGGCPVGWNPHVGKEAPDHRRICEALRRGGANGFWQRAQHEDRKAAAENLLGIAVEEN